MVEIGFRVSTRETLTTPEYQFQEIFALAERAETVGFDSVWAGDSLVERPRLEPLTVLSAVAALTETVELGTACLITPMRNPVRLAQTWATLDIVSEGRTLMGACMGTPQQGNKEQYDIMGVPHERRATVLEEGIEVMNALWADGAVTYDGEYFEYDDVSFSTGNERTPLRPVQDDPPVLVASNPGLHDEPAVVDPAVRRIVDVGDGWLTCCRADHPGEFERQYAAIADYAEDQGRNPDDLRVVYNLATHLADSQSAAKRAMTDYVTRYFPQYDPGIVDDMGPAGTADDVIDHIQRFHDLGVDEFVFRFEAEDRREQLERFADEVLPSFST